jgi:hypothetical protein
MRFWPTATANNYQFLGGIALYDSGSGKFIIFGLGTRGNLEMRIAQFNSTTSYSNQYLELATWGLPGRAGLIDLYLHDDGTTRNYYLIGDGSLANKVLLVSTSHSDFITPTHVGMFTAPGDNVAPSGPTQITVVDWTQTT